MYKDKDKQREANAERQRRYKGRQKALLKSVTSVGVTDKALPLCPYCLKRPTLNDNAIACEICSQMTLVSPKRGKDIKCLGDLPQILGKNTYFLNCATGKPGDADYNGICTDEWRAGRGTIDG